VKTILDWLRAFDVATDDEAAARCLQEAQRLCLDCFSWRELLSESALRARCDSQTIERFAEETLAHAKREKAVWGFRDVASIAMTRLNRPDLARHALDAAFETFEAVSIDAMRLDSVKGYDWILLAEGYLYTFDDHVLAQRSLKTGLERARASTRADDLIFLSEAVAKFASTSQGKALMHEAETLSENGTADASQVASGWFALGERADALRVLERAVLAAESSSELVRLAQTLHLHAEQSNAAAVLESALAKAKTLRDFLAVAELAGEAKLSDTLLAKAVAFAEPLVVDDVNRGRLEQINALWLKDTSLQARLGQTGVRPDACGGRRVVGFRHIHPSAEPLFDWLRMQLSPIQLRVIAEADYGSDVEKHLCVLQRMCASGRVPRVLDWEPKEVLELTRWNSGENTDHVARAFCTLLLMLDAGAWSEWHKNGAILFESCLALGIPAVNLCVQLFAWCSAMESADKPSRATAVILLSMAALEDAPDNARMQEVEARLLTLGRDELDAIGEELLDSTVAKLWVSLLERCSHRNQASVAICTELHRLQAIVAD
jgi:hypothetical protein